MENTSNEIEIEEVAHETVKTGAVHEIEATGVVQEIETTEVVHAKDLIRADQETGPTGVVRETANEVVIGSEGLKID